MGTNENNPLGPKREFGIRISRSIVAEYQRRNLFPMLRIEHCNTQPSNRLFFTVSLDVIQDLLADAEKQINSPHVLCRAKRMYLAVRYQMRSLLKSQMNCKEPGPVRLADAKMSMSDHRDWDIERGISIRPTPDIFAMTSRRMRVSAAKMKTMHGATYNPEAMLNHVMRMFHLKNDVELSSVLGVHSSVISSIRHCRRSVGAVLLIRAHEVTGMNTRDLRSLMGDNRKKFEMFSRSED